MTGPAKVLIVLICILSVAFAAISAVLFSTRQDYRDILEKAKERYAEDVAKLRGANEQLKENLIRVRTERDEHRTRAVSAEAKVRLLEHEVGRLQTEVVDRNNQIMGLQTDLKTTLEKANLWMAQNQELMGQVRQRENEILKLTQELQKSSQENQTLRTANADLQSELEKTKERLTVADATVDRQQKILDILFERFIEARPIIKSGVAVPDLRGKVLFVNKEYGNVIINLGEKQGVRKNYEFTVYRGSQFIGKIVIIDLQEEDMAAGKITLLAQGQEIRQGDSVATRIAL